MTAGRLAAAAPAATTSTVLYSSDVDTTASTVLQVAERGGAAATYRVGLKDYTQELTMDANTYDFAKGNPISSYKMEILPGISRADATPGLLLEAEDLGGSARLLDVFVDTSTVTNYVKVLRTATVGIDATGIVGNFQGGETVTGGLSGFSATFRGIGTQLNVELPDITAGATAMNVSDGTASVAGSVFVLSADSPSPEIISVTSATFWNGTTGGADMVVTRGNLGTTAGTHTPGQLVTFYSASTTTTTVNEGAQFAAGDTTLTLTDGTAVLSGQYIQIGNEVLLVTNVAGNDATVERGQFGTADAAHADGSTVTPWNQGGQAQIEWFDGAEVITGATSNATVTTQFTATSSAIFVEGFVWGEVAGQETVPDSFTMDVDRTYLFDQSDASNTGFPLRFSDVQDGTAATPTPGTEYTTGVVKAGTAGTDGTIEITPTAQTPDPIYYFAEGNAGYSNTITVVLDPVFTEVFLYDVKGTWSTGDVFTIGTASLTVGTITGGKYGYVTGWDSTGGVLSVTLGAGSAAFAAGDVFVDTPLEQGAERQDTTVSSVTAATDLNNEDYIFYDYALSANGANKHSGIVVGPNSHIIVYASSADLSFQLNGFENTVSDFEVVHYNQTEGTTGGAAGGGGAAPPPTP